MAVIRHPDSWVERHQLGIGQPYRPTYSDALTLGPTHRRLLEAPLKPNSVAIDIGIPGSLRREDAAKLYELAYFGQGDVLILGLAHGLGAALVAQAICDAQRPGAIVGVDSEARIISRTRANLTAYNLITNVELVMEGPAAFCHTRATQAQKFGLVFVDHSPSYSDVLSVCGQLAALIAEGGFALFHDFNDRRNKEMASGGYGVYSGVVDGLPAPPFVFFGTFGCTGLYRNEGTFGATPSTQTPHTLVPRAS